MGISPKPYIPVSVSAEAKKLIIAQELTIQQIADRLKIDRNTVSRLGKEIGVPVLYAQRFRAIKGRDLQIEALRCRYEALGPAKRLEAFRNLFSKELEIKRQIAAAGRNRKAKAPLLEELAKLMLHLEVLSALVPEEFVKLETPIWADGLKRIAGKMREKE